mmetsp:Transcript_14001/g.21823  ORF Transcript_14001/g.21823 Transcript_14001/m.21823 type:complete len:134 (-) Transcript_14001:76-477(-)
MNQLLQKQKVKSTTDIDLDDHGEEDQTLHAKKPGMPGEALLEILEGQIETYIPQNCFITNLSPSKGILVQDIEDYVVEKQVVPKKDGKPSQGRPMVFTINCQLENQFENPLEKSSLALKAHSQIWISNYGLSA